MRARVCLTGLAIVALVFVVSGGSAPEVAASKGAGQDTTTLDDQVELSVTVYNSDLAVLRGGPNVPPPPGRGPTRRGSPSASRITNTICSSLRSCSGNT